MSSMARSLTVENILPQNVGSITNHCSNLLKQQNGELQVAVDHNQLRTMASETVDPIDWSHTSPSWAVPPERLLHSINRCSLSSTGIRSCNFSMRGNHLAYAATKGLTYKQFNANNNKNQIIYSMVMSHYSTYLMKNGFHA